MATDSDLPLASGSLSDGAKCSHGIEEGRADGGDGKTPDPKAGRKTPHSTAKLDWDRTELHYGCAQWVILVTIVVLITLVLVLGVVQLIGWEWVRGITLAFVLVGGILRSAAHGQKNSGWQFLDGVGKLIAYYAAMVVLLSFWASVVAATPGAGQGIAP